jgi:putative flippase GtrA
MKSLFRWIKFNAVGIAGAVIQFWFLHMLLRANVYYLTATALAVEAAVLHNFAWHQRYTWADRPCDDLSSVLSRLLRFHLSNGVVSIGGNVLLMRWLAGDLGMLPLVANFLAILVCSIVNYFLGDRFVFRDALKSTAAGWKQCYRSKCDNGSETPDAS